MCLISPLVTLDTFDQHSLPQFKPLHCKIREVTIRGVLFRSTAKNYTDTFTLDVSDSVCESCFRGLVGFQKDLVKHYKHCVTELQLIRKMRTTVSYDRIR
jgi:hypothetical protein